jgi:hypothetical protein
MDYCHPCRRHLNGAFACPGCGTSAEVCRAYAGAPTDDPADPSGEAWGDPDETVPRGRSRRTRRVQRRRRRRAAYAGAGLVLAAGALSLAQVSIENPFQGAQDAAALGDDQDDGTPSGDGSAPAGTPSGSPSDPAPSATHGTGRHRRTGQPEETAADDESTGRHRGPGADDATQPSSRPGSPGTRAPAPSTPPVSDNPAPATSQPPAASEPDPEPSRSCTWVVVWWCS